MHNKWESPLHNSPYFPASIQIDRQKALEWLHKGAQPTDTVRRILSFKGVLYLKHLLRGVTLGLFDEATAMEKFTKWSTEHDSEFAKRQESHKKSKTSSRTPVARRTSAPVGGKVAGTAVTQTAAVEATKKPEVLQPAVEEVNESAGSPASDSAK